LTAIYHPPMIVKGWQDVTGYAKPTIRHVRLEGSGDLKLGAGKDYEVVITWLADAHTLEIGRGFAPDFYPDFWDDLKQLGPQLETVRFEIPEETEPFQFDREEYKAWGGLLDSIEELVTYRFEHGRPFSVVERMVVSESEWVNRQQDFVWRCFYNTRLDQYVGHE